MSGAPDKGSDRKKQKGKPAKTRKRRRGPTRPAESTAAILERLLLEQVEIAVNDVPTKMPALEAILYRLLARDLKGDHRATSVLLKYKRLVKAATNARPQVVFADSEYSRSLSGGTVEQGDG